MLKTRLLLFPMLLLIASCDPPGSGQNDNCGSWRAVYISPKDKLTPETERMILENNMTGHILCDWPYAG